MFQLVLFGHLTAVALLFAAGGIALTTLLRIRDARDVAQLRIALGNGPLISILFPLASVGVIATGAALVKLAGIPVTTPWLDLSVALTLTLVVVGATVTGPRLQNVARAAAQAPGPALDARLDKLRNDPVMHLVELLSISEAVGLLFLMSNRPDAAGSLVTIAAALLGGLATYTSRISAGRPLRR